MQEEPVSVVVLTYNPNKDKLEKTLQSIINQKDIPVEIVISDDGSRDNLFSFAESFFIQHSFAKYRLVAAEKNEGTVKNTLKGVMNCRGQYIKLLSPGDYFCSDHILKEWVDFTAGNKFEWSFSDVYCYVTENGEQKIVSRPAHPMITDVYKSNSFEKCIWNYLVLEDIVLGAATLCRREMAQQYLIQLKESVIYAEDNMYRLMMFDGIVGAYFDNETICYEVGSGISTSGESQWEKRLRKDWEATTLIIKNRNSKSDFQQAVVNGIINTEKTKSKLGQIFSIKGSLWFRIRRKLWKRNTRIT